MRGNREGGEVQPAPHRTIPACAGEPCWCCGLRRLVQDYPRVCGGTARSRLRTGPRPGLSPRVRGNRTWSAYALASFGTIPACAGEPSRSRATSTCGRDYPRVCGGTPGPAFGRPSEGGLSPRVRGNHEDPISGDEQQGTIPACAGEPRRTTALSRRTRDYPRVCGGTYVSARDTHTQKGLSPRVRGNLSFMYTQLRQSRTIPACAGEPRSPSPRHPRPRDYPRVCGGTRVLFCLTHLLEGLSPRVRGNPPGARAA